jgi:hypothetical protein
VGCEIFLRHADIEFVGTRHGPQPARQRAENLVEPIAVFLYFDWQQLLQFCRKQLQQGLVALRCVDCFYGDGHRSLLSPERLGDCAFLPGKIISIYQVAEAGVDH